MADGCADHSYHADETKTSDKDELAQSNCNIEADNKPVNVKTSKKYSKGRSGARIKATSSHDSPGNNEDYEEKVRPGPNSRVTKNIDSENQSKDSSVKQTAVQSSCKEMGDNCKETYQESSVDKKTEKSEEVINVTDKEMQKKERKTRKGFEPYQIKKGRLYGAVAPSESKTAIGNKTDSKGASKGRQTARDVKQIDKRSSPHKTGDGLQKGRKEFQTNRPREQKELLSDEKNKTKNIGRIVGEENWDSPTQSSDIDISTSHASPKNAKISDIDILSTNSCDLSKDKTEEPSEIKTAAIDSSKDSLLTTDKSMSNQNQQSKQGGSITESELRTKNYQKELGQLECDKGKSTKQGNSKIIGASLSADVVESNRKPHDKKIYEVPSYNRKGRRAESRERKREATRQNCENLNLDVKFDNEKKSDSSVSGYMELINKFADQGEMDWDLDTNKEKSISEEKDKTEKASLEKNKDNIRSDKNKDNIHSDKNKDNICSDKNNTKKVSFPNECQSIGNENKVKSKSDQKESKSKTAGIIVLPSPDVLKKDVRMTLEEEEKNKQLYDPKSGKRGIINRNHERSQRKEEDVDLSYKAVNFEARIDSKSIRITSSGKELWKEVQQGLRSLKKLLSADFDCLDSLDKMLELSAMLQDLFKELIVKHQDISFKNDVEGCLWKNTFHSMISKFRSYLDEEKDTPHVNDISQYYWNVLQDGDDFLEDLLYSIQEEHGFDVHEFAANPLKMAGCKKQVKLAVRSCHLILLYLGDLERYIADLKADNNYLKANEKYQKAQSLAPKNGKSYNQMAIVAVKCKRKLDALYYYVRSLEASNPIESARERLIGIFQDIKRKAEQTKNQSTAGEVASFADAVKMNEQKKREYEDYLLDYSGEDIWVFYRSGKYYKLKIMPNGKIQELGSHSDGKDNNENDTETAKVSLRELNKEFLIYYLFMQSKLYTRIGFESIMNVYQDTLRPFKLLVEHERASSMKRSNLVKYMAINIFSVNNLFNKQDQKMEVVRNSPIDTAIIFGMDMCSQISAHCATLLQNANDKNQMILDQYLPSIRTWMKWMCVFMDLVKESSVCHMKDILENMVLFFNATRSMTTKSVQETPDGEPTALFEDVFLAGFQPLIDMETPSMKVPKDIQESAEQYMRSESLKDITFMISESHKLPIIFSDNSSSFEVLTPEVLIESPAKNGDTVLLEEDEKDLEDDDSDVIIEDVFDESDEESRHLRELMAQKMQLIAKLKEQERKEKERAAIVASNVSQVHMVSENHPKYIVPDTNCFIDNLEGLKRIIDSRDFIVILPLIVVNELDGLKKGTISNKYPTEAHALHVKERARMSIELLENRFGEGDSQLKALTSVGTELDTIAFRDEELSRDQGKNDDIILSCCLHYCEEAMNRYCSNEGPLVVQRKVVLLTDDRNLRLKAHSRNVPTISIKTFLKMAAL